MNTQYVKGKPIFTSINKSNNQYAYLNKDIDVDICIIGGGVTGALAAYYLSKNNAKIALVEKNRVGYLSTSVTTSLLQYELDDNIDELKNIIKPEDVIRAYKLGIKALDEIESFAKQYGNNFNYVKRDCLLYTDNVYEKKIIKNEYNYRNQNGLDVEYIEHSMKYGFLVEAGLISNHGAAEIDPYKFTHQLLDVAQSRHCKVYEHTEIIEINHFDDYVQLRCEYNNIIKAKKVIVATGYNTDLFTTRQFASKTTTYNIATKPIDELEQWDERILIRDNNDPYTYLRTTQDNRIIIGGEDEEFIVSISDEGLANKKYNILEEKLKSMYKNIKSDIEVEYKYCGAFASTKDNLGFVGPDNVNKNIWYLLGYGANGILFAVLGAMMLSKLYNNQVDPDMDLFKVDRFDT